MRRENARGRSSGERRTGRAHRSIVDARVELGSEHGLHERLPIRDHQAVASLAGPSAAKLLVVDDLHCRLAGGVVLGQARDGSGGEGHGYNLARKESTCARSRMAREGQRGAASAGREGPSEW